MPHILAECEDGINNNDADGLIDMADPDCSSTTDDNESSAPLPDLTASSTPTTATTNVARTYTSTISNIGDTGTLISFPYFFQKATEANGGGTITGLVSSTMTNLASGANNTATSPSITFSVAGVYSVRVCADKTSSSGGGNIVESDEDNNCNPWADVTVADVVDGYYSGWSDCDVTECGQTGTQTAICVPPSPGGDPCPIPVPTQQCNTQACGPSFPGQCPVPEKGSNKRCVNEDGTINGDLYAGDYKSFASIVTWTCNGWGTPPGASAKCSEPNKPGFRENQQSYLLVKKLPKK